MPLGGLDSKNLRDALRRRPGAVDVVAVRRRGGGLGLEDGASVATGGGALCSSSSSTSGNDSMAGGVVGDMESVYIGLDRMGVRLFN